MRFYLLVSLLVLLGPPLLQAQVDSATYQPRLIGAPPVACVEVGRAHFDSLWVSDSDLVVPGRNEVVMLEVVEPAGAFTVSPSRITGPLPNDTVGFRIDASAIPNQFSGQKMWISVVARDLEGRSDTLRYYISISHPVPVSMSLEIRNTGIGGRNSMQTLIFGIGEHASTGTELSSPGKLDSHYCEYELPPLPLRSMFDARWRIPPTGGTLRNIIAPFTPELQDSIGWLGAYTTDGDGASPNSPYVIRWSRKDAERFPFPLTISDPFDGYFRVDMKSGKGSHVPGLYVIEIDNDSIAIRIDITNLSGFLIRPVPWRGLSRVPVSAEREQALSAFPNPLSTTTTVAYHLPVRRHVSIDIYDIRGEHVRHLLSGTVEPGEHQVVWDGREDTGRDLASGVYTCQLKSGDDNRTLRVVVLR